MVLPLRRPAGQLLILYLAFILLGLSMPGHRFILFGVVLMWLILYLPYLACDYGADGTGNG